MFNFPKNNKEPLIHGIKTAIACIVGIFVSHLIGVQESGPWVVITIATVMCAQLYVGSVFKKAYLRLLGTLVGTFVCITVILLTNNNNVAILMAIALAGFCFSYFSLGDENLSFAGTLGLVTVIIILLSPHPSLSTALLRCFEIAVGILIAGLISQFVLPINARTHLRQAQAETLEQIRLYYLHIEKHGQSEEEDYHTLDENIAKSILKQRQLAKESSKELFGEKFNTEHFMNLLYAEREMLRAITFMHIALSHDKQLRLLFSKNMLIQAFNKRISELFSQLIQLMKTPARTEIKIRFPSLKNVKETLSSALAKATPDEHINYDGFIFSAEVLVQSLKNFAKLHKISFKDTN